MFDEVPLPPDDAEAASEVSGASASSLPFLDVVLPAEGWRCMWAKKAGERPKQTFHRDNADMAVQLTAFDAQGWDVYFCTSTLKESGNRKAPNVHSLRAFRLDADVKPGAYATVRDAAAAALAFLLPLGLQATLVKSGFGLHVYIVLTEAIPPEQWLPAARALDQRAKAAGLLLDHGVTTDPVRILRPPGTYNRKKPESPQPVTLLYGPYTNPTRAVLNALGAPGSVVDRPARPAPKEHTRSSDAPSSFLGDMHGPQPPASAAIVAQHCAQLARMRATKKGNGSWYHLLGVLAYCDVDGDALAQAWSAEHKNYTPEETAEKLARQRAETSGPTTCATLERLNPAGCQGCPYRATVTTPVQLGRFSAKDAEPFLSFVSNVKAADWGEPDLSLVELQRRSPPVFPLDLLGAFWRGWVEAAAEANAAPVDYVALTLIATGSALIGNSRWPRIGGWMEPPHVWIGLVGDSGSSKSPGAGCLLNYIVPELQRKMAAGFPEKLHAWKVAEAEADAQEAAWKEKLKKAAKEAKPMPAQPQIQSRPKPESPCLLQNDVTIERVATVLATAAEKGLLIHRDELAGWFLGMTAYNESGRQFWLQAFNGHSYRVERQKHPEPIIVRHLAVAVIGGVQPERLAEMFADADDGLMSRMLWGWPDPLKFRLGQRQPDQAAAFEALDKLRRLEMVARLVMDASEGRQPVYVLLAKDSGPLIEAFGQRMQAEQQFAAGLMRSAYGKARGLALRLSLVLEYLWWCADRGGAPEPREISVRAVQAACTLVGDYFMPMALRVYGDAALPDEERNAVALARWIMRTKPQEVHVRNLQREVRLPGLTDASKIHAAAEALVDANWLRRVDAGGTRGRPKGIYAVNPALFHGAPGGRACE